MKCPVLLTSEVSGLKTERDNMFQLYKEVNNGNMLSAIRTGAGNVRTDSLDTSSRNNRHIRQADGEMERHRTCECRLFFE